MASHAALDSLAVLLKNLDVSFEGFNTSNDSRELTLVLLKQLARFFFEETQLVAALHDHVAPGSPLRIKRTLTEVKARIVLFL
jgi:hypothetical protein